MVPTPMNSTIYELPNKFVCGAIHNQKNKSFKSLQVLFGHFLWEHQGLISEGSVIETIVVDKDMKVKYFLKNHKDI